MEKTKFGIEIPIKTTIEEGDYVIGTAKGKDFRIKATDFQKKVLANSQIDRYLDMFKPSKNIKIERNQDSINLYYQDDELQAKYQELLQNMNRLSAAMSTIMASKGTMWNELIISNLDPQQFIIDEITNQIQAIKETVTPIEFLDIVDTQDSNLQFSITPQNELRFVYNPETNPSTLSIDYNLRQAKLNELMASTFRIMYICHLDLTPFCEQYRTELGSESNLSFTNFSYTKIIDFQKKTNDVILRLITQQKNAPIDFQFLTKDELGYFEVPDNGQFIICKRDLSLYNLNDEKLSKFIQNDEVKDFQHTSLFVIKDIKSSNHFFSIFSYQEDQITFFRDEDNFLLFAEEQTETLSATFLDATKPTYVCVTIHKNEVKCFIKNTIILQMTMNLSDAMVTKLVNNNFHISLIADNGGWLCGGLTTFTTYFTLEDFDYYVGNIYETIS